MTLNRQSLISHQSNFLYISLLVTNHPRGISLPYYQRHLRKFERENEGSTVLMSSLFAEAATRRCSLE